MEKPVRIRKAVIPAAGLGTRFLPATKVVPKEMFPIGGKPLVQYAVEEAVASGLDTIILVISPGKRLLAEYFQDSPAVQGRRTSSACDAEIAALRRLIQTADIRTVWQDSPRGLADAIGCARLQVGEEPFAVLLPDALIDSTVPCTRQLIECYEKHPGCVIATRQVDTSEVERFGILDVIPVVDSHFPGRVLKVTSLSERPDPQRVTSRYGIFGRYILDPAIFACIGQLSPGFGGELQLTDALMACTGMVPVYGFCFEGAHYDAGEKLGLIRASIDFALKDPLLQDRLRHHLEIKDSSAGASGL